MSFICRCDELESLLSKHGSLRKLYIYHQHLIVVIINTMIGPERRPQHCCEWLGIASSFPEEIHKRRRTFSENMFDFGISCVGKEFVKDISHIPKGYLPHLMEKCVLSKRVL
ncbi:unnamed protein product [Trifolium pratense]|uniref:Uncharacterized protein n=1 Tax=Trifolium pratense TaxID=57577 RepID=A0ACB0J3T4_TRIPR|nr:unnamed protein product [Trifolium pratense]